MRVSIKKIEAALADARMSKGEMAKRMGIRQPTLSQMLRATGWREFQPSTVGRMAKALGVAVADIQAAPRKAKNGAKP